MNLSETADRLREYDKILAQRDELQKEHVELSCEIQRGLQRFADMTKQRDELREACEAVASLRGKTLLGDPSEGSNYCVGYSKGANLAFEEAASLVANALARCTAPEAPSVDGPTAAQADEILGKPHYSAQPKGRWD